MIRYIVMFVLSASIWSGGTLYVSAQTDQTLYAFHNAPLFDGKFGKVALAQSAIEKASGECGGVGVEVNGEFGASTSKAIKALADCGALKNRLPASSTAFHGELTQDLWKILLPEAAPPSVEERAQTLVLTYEATDYDKLEWNFCQNKPFWSPAQPDKPCYTNDPRSYITWGPRGATAGGGREVQWIIARVDRGNPALVDQAFGDEADVVRSLLKINEESTRRLLCAVFNDEQRRVKWINGFAKFGTFPEVRIAYQLHYASLASDGSKMRALYGIYQRLGIPPTEIDYGFFLDRATHTSTPEDPKEAASRIRDILLSKHLSLSPSNVRRVFSSAFPTANQTADRLGRDVAFFVDATSEAGLTGGEIKAWRARGRLRASDVGLSDSRPAPTLSIAKSIEAPAFNVTLSPLPACPASVLHPIHP